MSIEVVVANTEDLRRKAFRLRYQVFVDELGYEVPLANPEEGLVDPEDETAHVLLAMEDGRAIGSMTLDWWAETELRPQTIEGFQLRAFPSQLEKESVVVVRKLLVAGSHRGRRVVEKLMSAAVETLLCPGIHYAFIDCSPYLVRYYERLGFRQYAGHFDHDGILSVPMCCVLTDQKHLEACRSPLAKWVRQAGLADQSDAKCFCTTEWPGSARTEPVATTDLPEWPAEQPEFDVRQARLFEGLETEEVDHLLAETEAVSFERRGAVLQPGDDHFGLVVPTKGFAEVVMLRSGEPTAVGTVGPGDLLGEMELLLGTNGGASVVALGEMAGIRIPPHRLDAQPPTIKAKLFKNLGAILADRLRVSYRFTSLPVPL
ncbi:MAG: GNAT family N-acetyltransferase [Myxococcota bacterium]